MSTATTSFQPPTLPPRTTKGADICTTPSPTKQSSEDWTTPLKPVTKPSLLAFSSSSQSMSTLDSTNNDYRVSHLDLDSHSQLDCGMSVTTSESLESSSKPKRRHSDVSRLPSMRSETEGTFRITSASELVRQREKQKEIQQQRDLLRRQRSQKSTRSDRERHRHGARTKSERGHHHKSERSRRRHNEKSSYDSGLKSSSSLRSVKSNTSSSRSSEAIAWGGYLQVRQLDQTTCFNSGPIGWALRGLFSFSPSFGVLKEKGFYFIEGTSLRKRGTVSTKGWLNGVTAQAQQSEVMFDFERIMRVEGPANRGKMLLVFLSSPPRGISTIREEEVDNEHADGTDDRRSITTSYVSQSSNGLWDSSQFSNKHEGAGGNTFSEEPVRGGGVFEIRSHSRRELRALQQILERFVPAPVKQPRHDKTLVMEVKTAVKPKYVPVMKIERSVDIVMMKQQQKNHDLKRSGSESLTESPVVSIRI